MDSQALIEIQNAIVLSLSRAPELERGWSQVVVNMEIVEGEDGYPTENGLCLFYTVDEGQWNRNSFKVPFECYDQFGELRKLTKKENEPAWSSCTVEFDSSGKYKFSYSYDPPARINGILDDTSLLRNYQPGKL